MFSPIADENVPCTVAVATDQVRRPRLERHEPTVPGDVRSRAGAVRLRAAGAGLRAVWAQIPVEPSRVSRMMSAWPAWRAVSWIM